MVSLIYAESNPKLIELYRVGAVFTINLKNKTLAITSSTTYWNYTIIYVWLNGILNSNSLRIVNTNVLDWNAIVEIGIYSGNDAQNAPINHNDGWINAIVLASNGNPNFLSLFAFSASKMFLRQMDNTIWNEWVQIK